MIQTTKMHWSARFLPSFSADRFERSYYVRTRSAPLSQRARFVRTLVIYGGGVRSPPATGRRCGSRQQIGAGAGGGAAKSATLCLRQLGVFRITRFRTWISAASGLRCVIPDSLSVVGGGPRLRGGRLRFDSEA